VIRDFQNKRYQPSNLCIFFNYVLFFPALIAGPIDRIEHFENEINKKSEKSQDFIYGGKRLIVGLIKKFVIADTLVLIALNSDNALLVKSPVWLWVMLITYAWMIYYDFSGYTDIALGLSACIGIVLPENFDHPYSAQNLTIFWNKWHMTLTQWFRSYFFNPVTRFLRSRKKPISPTIIIALTQISTMTLIGLWHGISMNYIIWGLWHGIGIFIHNRWAFFMQKYQRRDGVDIYIQNLLSKISVVITFIFVSLGWIWFVIPDPQISQSVFKMLFGLR
jgi:D-alanyl-lipoteichoic acid acyltransferase DltB (MBOAT superfamily)